MKKTLAILALGGLLLGGCTKGFNDPAGSKKALNIKAMSRSDISFTDLPTLSEGRLSFRDNDHYIAYVNYLEQVTANEDSTSTDSVDVAQLYSDIENGLNFQSLRRNVESDFEALNQIGWASTDNIPEKHFISSTAILSTLNPQGEVEVDGKVTRYINASYAIEAEKSVYNDNINDIRDLPESATYDDIQGIIPPNAANFIDILELKCQSLGSLVGHKPTVLGFSIQGATVISANDCLVKTKVTLKGARISFFDFGGTTPPMDVEGGVLIKWGDGTSQWVATTALPGNNRYGIPDVNHTYAASFYHGTITILLSATSSAPPFSGSSLVVTDQPLVFNASAVTSCNQGKEATSSTTWHYSQDGTRAYSTKSWFWQYTNNWGDKKHQNGARTDAYYWDNGVYRKWKNCPKTVAQYMMDLYDANCNPTGSEVGADWANKSWEAETSHTTSGEKGWYSMWSNHRMYLNSSYFMGNDVTLTPCP